MSSKSSRSSRRSKSFSRSHKSPHVVVQVIRSIQVLQLPLKTDKSFRSRRPCHQVVPCRHPGHTCHPKSSSGSQSPPRPPSHSMSSARSRKSPQVVHICRTSHPQSSSRSQCPPRSRRSSREGRPGGPREGLAPWGRKALNGDATLPDVGVGSRSRYHHPINNAMCTIISGDSEVLLIMHNEGPHRH